MDRPDGGVARQPQRRYGALAGTRLDRADPGLALHIVGNPPDTEDACQEALLAAWSAWPRLRNPVRFDASFDRILVNASSTNSGAGSSTAAGGASR